MVLPQYLIRMGVIASVSEAIQLQKHRYELLRSFYSLAMTVFIVICAFPAQAQDCASPNAVIGEMVFNTTHGAFQGCTQMGWQAFHQPVCPAGDGCIPASADPCDPVNIPAPGQLCNDGTIYAGLSPDGNVPMFTTSADAGRFPWNNGNDNYLSMIATGQSSMLTGEANTQALAVIDSDSQSAGTQPHAAALHCAELDEHGHEDWYVPAINELNVLFVSRVAIGSFDTTGYPQSLYVSSTESTGNATTLYSGMYFHDGFINGDLLKHEAGYLRCVRK